jgi:hypothetical protein
VGTEIRSYLIRVMIAMNRAAHDVDVGPTEAQEAVGGGDPDQKS